MVKMHMCEHCGEREANYTLSGQSFQDLEGAFYARDCLVMVGLAVLREQIRARRREREEAEARVCNSKTRDSSGQIWTCLQPKHEHGEFHNREIGGNGFNWTEGGLCGAQLRTASCAFDAMCALDGNHCGDHAAPVEGQVPWVYWSEPADVWLGRLVARYTGKEAFVVEAAGGCLEAGSAGSSLVCSPNELEQRDTNSLLFLLSRNRFPRAALPAPLEQPEGIAAFAGVVSESAKSWSGVADSARLPEGVVTGIDFAKGCSRLERERIIAGMTHVHPRNVAARQRLELRAALDRPLPPTKTAGMLALGHPRTWPSQDGED